jgi:predicted GIY-YIG superfamily endonuclease
MQFYVYMQRCADGSYYTGHTDNLKGRLWQHNHGIGSDWTNRRRPVELVWCDTAPTRDEAFAFERRLKGWTRAKKEALIAGDWDRVSWLARPPHPRPSTSLRASDVEERPSDLARPERSAKRVVEGPVPSILENRPSTLLRTSGVELGSDA